MSNTYVVGGSQTDFARNWSKEGLGLVDLLGEVVPASLSDAGIESGRYDVALVVGVELMRNVPAAEAAANLATEAWAGREAVDAEFAWPALFADVASEYDKRYGLDHKVLGRFAEIAFENGRDNPLAQTRDWQFPERSFAADDEVNPLVEGCLRKTDCGRITDDAAAIVDHAQRWAAERGLTLGDLARISGFGHRTDTLLLADKLAGSAHNEHLFPQLYGHDPGCVCTSQYRRHRGHRRRGDARLLHDHWSSELGASGPGGWRQGRRGGPRRHHRADRKSDGQPGRRPVGGRHRVGATGVRMVLDAQRQVTGQAGAQQIDGARRVLTVNVGGSFTTTVAFVVESSTS